MIKMNNSITSTHNVLKAVFIVLLAISITSCASKLQGQVKKNIYHSPNKAYSLILDNVIFRGEVEIDERCDQTGGSTTFFDQMDRLFKVDYLVIDENDLAQSPDFASDETLLSGVFNNYVKEVIAPAQVVQSSDIIHRETIKLLGFTVIYSMVKVDLEAVTKKQKRKNVDGLYYYGLLTFRRGDFVYIIQHKQGAELVDQSREVLQAFFREMTIPGKQKKETMGERTQRYISKGFAFMPGVEAYEKYSKRVCE